MPALAANSSLVGQLAVTVNGNASGSFSALARAGWASTPSGAPLSTPSNAHVISLPVRPAAIAYFSSASYSAPSAVGSAGAPLFVQLDAAACNVDPTRVLTVPVSVTSQLTGDTETFAATETAPNTGLFRIQPDVPTADATARPVASGDGVLEVLRNDVVTANVTHCGSVAVSVSTTLLNDPSGVVFDSHSNAPVAGVTVQLDRKSTRLNSSHTVISYAVFCLKKKTKHRRLRAPLFTCRGAVRDLADARRRHVREKRARHQHEHIRRERSQRARDRVPHRASAA